MFRFVKNAVSLNRVVVIFIEEENVSICYKPKINKSIYNNNNNNNNNNNKKYPVFIT